SSALRIKTPFCSCVSPSLLWPLLTPQRLSAPGSPRVGICSFRSRLGSTECHQWLLGFVFASTLAPDILPHCPFVFLRSNVCLPPFRAASLRRRPGGSATVGTTSPRREPFIPPDQTPAGHTSADILVCGCWGLSSPQFVSAGKIAELESSANPQAGKPALPVAASPFRSAGRRPARAGRPCYPFYGGRERHSSAPTSTLISPLNTLNHNALH